MQKFLAVLKMYNQKLIEYRADVILWTLSGIIQPVLALLIWTTLLSSGVKTGYNNSDILIYFLAAMLISSFTSVWSSYFIATDINSGQASRYLIKPFSLFLDHISWNVSEKIYKVSITFIVIVIFCLFNLDTIKQFHFSWVAFFLSLICLVSAAIIHFYFDLIVGVITFWTHDNDFFRNFNFVGFQLFSGVMIPIALLPSILQNLALILPFRYTLSFPAEVLLNRLTTFDLALGFAIQILWLIATIFLYNFLYRKGLKIYQGFG